MNKLVVVIACILLITGCQPKEQAASTGASPSQADASKQAESQKVQVEKGLMNVEVTLPASFFKSQDLDKVVEKAKADGVNEVNKNPDGSVTYKMSKSVHSEMMKKLGTTISESVADLKSGGTFKSIKDVTHNKSFSEFTLVVDKEAYEKSFDGFASLGLGISAMYYQLFDGIPSDKVKVSMQVKDAATNTIFKSIVYPEALDKMKQ